MFDSTIQETIEVLKSGGVILYPTETVWGLGCDATNEEAVRKLMKIKQRDDSKSLIILLDNDIQLRRYAKHVPDVVFDITEYSTKPTTLILDGAYNVAPSTIAQDGSIGIRITTSEFCKKLIKTFKKPITSTSANISGEPTPITFNEISQQIQSLVDYTVDLKSETGTGTPSTIMKIGPNGAFRFIRK